MFENIPFARAVFGFALWWIVWFCVSCYIVYFYQNDLYFSILDSAINIILLSLTSVAVYNTIRFYRPTRGNLLYLRLWSFFHAWIITAAHNWLMSQLFESQSGFLENAWPIRYVFNLVMIGITFSMTMIYFYIIDEQEKKQRKDDAEKLARETELIKLRQQLQPHFLFNSLNSISALAGSKPEQARKMIQQLSDFLRGTLRKEEQQMVTLRDELKHLNLYLDIEKVRFGHRLNTQINIDESLLEMKLPSLLLQPIVENAIKFGLYDTTDEVLIVMNALVENKELIISIRNPFDAATAMPRKGTGFGLSSVQRRLHLLYGRTNLLKTQSQEMHFTTTVNIPQV